MLTIFVLGQKVIIFAPQAPCTIYTVVLAFLAAIVASETLSSGVQIVSSAIQVFGTGYASLRIFKAVIAEWVDARHTYAGLHGMLFVAFTTWRCSQDNDENEQEE